MYQDDPPVPNAKTRIVIVIEKGDSSRPDEVISFARDIGATTHDDGEDVFWVVFDNEPRRLWDFSEAILRADLARRPR